MDGWIYNLSTGTGHQSEHLPYLFLCQQTPNAFHIAEQSDPHALGRRMGCSNSTPSAGDIRPRSQQICMLGDKRTSSCHRYSLFRFLSSLLSIGLHQLRERDLRVRSTVQGRRQYPSYRTIMAYDYGETRCPLVLGNAFGELLLIDFNKSITHQCAYYIATPIEPAFYDEQELLLMVSQTDSFGAK